jgi:hypothetical protein
MPRSTPLTLMHDQSKEIIDMLVLFLTLLSLVRLQFQLLIYYLVNRITCELLDGEGGRVPDKIVNLVAHAGKPLKVDNQNPRSYLY